MAERVHWTKRPENKAKLAEMIARGTASRMNGKRKGHAKKSTSLRRKDVSSQAPLAEHIAYLYGRIERDLENYSIGNQLPFSSLAEGLAAILRHKASRP